jgi:hypothetical protein
VLAEAVLRLAYLGLASTFYLPRLLPMTDRNKDTETLVLRYQIAVLHQDIANARPIQPLPSLITGQNQITRLGIRRHPRLDSIFNKYRRAA